MCVKTVCGWCGEGEAIHENLTAHVCNNETPWLATTEDMRIKPMPAG